MASSQAASAAKQDEKEAHLQQAATELGSGQHDSIQKATVANNVATSTLCHQMEGCPAKVTAQNAQQTLIPAAESVLIKHIQCCALSSFPLTLALLMEYANTITHPVPGTSKPIKVTHSWLQLFLIQHSLIWSHWSQCLDNQCLTGTMEDNIWQWFTQLSNICYDHQLTWSESRPRALLGQGKHP